MTQTQQAQSETQTQQAQVGPRTLAAWRLAVGLDRPDQDTRRIRGAWNDYSARGRGATYARRVLPAGSSSWTWVSELPSRGRYLSADRHDVRCGDVCSGDLIAEYTLGGHREPDQWRLVVADGTDSPALVRLDARRRRDGAWTIRLSRVAAGEACLPPEVPDSLVVPDPYWR